MSARLLVYGAKGYTGELLARGAAARRLRRVLAGRNTAAVAALAGELGLEHVSFPLDESARVEQGLRGSVAVVHCAGPFSRTAGPMAEACLRAGVHYLDV